MRNWHAGTTEEGRSSYTALLQRGSGTGGGGGFFSAMDSYRWSTGEPSTPPSRRRGQGHEGSVAHHHHPASSSSPHAGSSSLLSSPVLLLSQRRDLNESPYKNSSPSHNVSSLMAGAPLQPPSGSAVVENRPLAVNDEKDKDNHSDADGVSKILFLEHSSTHHREQPPLPSSSDAPPSSSPPPSPMVVAATRAGSTQNGGALHSACDELALSEQDQHPPPPSRRTAVLNRRDEVNAARRTNESEAERVALCGSRAAAEATTGAGVGVDNREGRTPLPGLHWSPAAVFPETAGLPPSYPHPSHSRATWDAEVAKQARRFTADASSQLSLTMTTTSSLAEEDETMVEDDASRNNPLWQNAGSSLPPPQARHADAAQCLVAHLHEAELPHGSAIGGERVGAMGDSGLFSQQSVSTPLPNATAASQERFLQRQHSSFDEPSEWSSLHSLPSRPATGVEMNLEEEEQGGFDAQDGRLNGEEFEDEDEDEEGQPKRLSRHIPLRDGVDYSMAAYHLIQSQPSDSISRRGFTPTPPPNSSFANPNTGMTSGGVVAPPAAVPLHGTSSGSSMTSSPVVFSSSGVEGSAPPATSASASAFLGGLSLVGGGSPSGVMGSPSSLYSFTDSMVSDDSSVMASLYRDRLAGQLAGAGGVGEDYTSGSQHAAWHANEERGHHTNHHHPSGSTTMTMSTSTTGLLRRRMPSSSASASSGAGAGGGGSNGNGTTGATVTASAAGAAPSLVGGEVLQFRPCGPGGAVGVDPAVQECGSRAVDGAKHHPILRTSSPDGCTSFSARAGNRETQDHSHRHRASQAQGSPSSTRDGGSRGGVTAGHHHASAVYHSNGINHTNTTSQHRITGVPLRGNHHRSRSSSSHNHNHHNNSSNNRALQSGVSRTGSEAISGITPSTTTMTLLSAREAFRLGRHRGPTIGSGSASVTGNPVPLSHPSHHHTGLGAGGRGQTTILRRRLNVHPIRVLEAPSFPRRSSQLLDWGCHNRLAIGMGNMLYLWNGETGSATALVAQEPKETVERVLWVQRCSYVAVASVSGTTRVYDGERGAFLRALWGPTESHNTRAGGSVASSCDATYGVTALAVRGPMLAIASASPKGIARVYDLRIKDALVQTFHGHLGRVTSLAYSPKEPYYLATGGEDGSVMVWDSRRGVVTPRAAFPHIHTGAVSALQWHPNRSRRLLSGGEDGVLCHLHIHSARLHPADGEEDCTPNEEGVGIASIPAVAVTRAHQTGYPITGLIWQPDGDEIVTAHRTKGHLQLRHAETLQYLGAFSAADNEADLSCLTLSPNKEHVCAAQADDTLKMWHVFSSSRATEKQRESQ